MNSIEKCREEFKVEAVRHVTKQVFTGHNTGYKAEIFSEKRSLKLAFA